MNLFSKKTKVTLSPSMPQDNIWPKCSPAIEGDWSNKYTTWRGDGTGTAGKCFMKKEVAPGDWEWVPDEETQKQVDEAEERFKQREQHRRDLFWALQTRVLTDEEFEEVRKFGDNLNIEQFTSYNQHEKKMELQNALYNQAKLKILSMKQGK